MSFDEWLFRLDELARRDDAMPCMSHIWRPYYDAGLTPQEAWEL